MGHKSIALVYLVAGISSRFGGRTKALINTGIGNKTIIEYSLEQAIKNPFSKIILIVSPKTKRQFQKKFKNSYKNIPILYALQKYDPKKRNRPWGTADAIISAKKYLNEPFILCNGDDIYGENSFKKLFSHLSKKETNAIIGYKLKEVVPKKSKVNRGIIISKNSKVLGINEKRNISISNLKSNKLKINDTCSMNLLALHPETLNLVENTLIKFKEKNKSERDIECGLPQTLSKLIKKNKIKMYLHKTSDKWLGVTNPEDEATLKLMIKQNK